MHPHHTHHLKIILEILWFDSANHLLFCSHHFFIAPRVSRGSCTFHGGFPPIPSTIAIIDSADNKNINTTLCSRAAKTIQSLAKSVLPTSSARQHGSMFEGRPGEEGRREREEGRQAIRVWMKKKKRSEYNERTASISNLLEYYTFIVSVLLVPLARHSQTYGGSTIDDDANNWQSNTPRPSKKRSPPTATLTDSLQLSHITPHSHFVRYPTYFHFYCSCTTLFAGITMI